MPVDRGAIDGQLREIGEGERWWEQREFRDLPHILHAEERIHGLINGRLLGRRRPRLLPAAVWLIVATDQRLICLQQQRFGRKQVDIHFGQVTGIQHGSGLRAYQITLKTPQRTFRLRIPKADAFRFMRALAPLVPNTGPATPAWLPGFSTLASLPGFSDVLALASGPAPDYATRGDLARLQSTVERLESEIERLHQQVDFLETLLHQRTDGVLSLPASSSDS